LKDKWKNELDYKLKKHLFCFQDNKIAVEFEYEFHDEKGQVSADCTVDHPLLSG
jgi:nuclear transport factor 2 (NTF2) superfamily protein